MSMTTQSTECLEEQLTPQQLEGKALKEAGDNAFKTGTDEGTLEALSNYHKALFQLRGLARYNPLTGNQPQENKPKSQLDEDLEKVYSNMSACHLRLKNYQRTIETADKALELNKDNYKAQFRKGKALGEQGFFEKAVPILTELITKNPKEAPTIEKELETLRKKEKEREREYNQKLRGFLNAKKDIFTRDDVINSAGTSHIPDGPPPTASIEELHIPDGPPPAASIEEIKDE
ncbi:hypothetical protein EW145_g4493 [Phellinidium pouzarii]|uniref:Uncharacterized protein n=1 Tax=Phellinidium pouzarii TaxID=167371 RepID=A0A4S4L3H1_9AGAM|nr:hypothetical protein EW145_g4493 [Phellinidium pouzarii]